MAVGIKEVDRFAVSLRSAAVTRSVQIADSVKVISIGYPALAHAFEGSFKLVRVHGKGQMFATLGSEWRELDGEVLIDSNHRKRRSFSLTLIAEPEHLRIELDALVTVVHEKNKVIKLRHGSRSCWSLRTMVALPPAVAMTTDCHLVPEMRRAEAASVSRSRARIGGRRECCWLELRARKAY